MAEEKEGFFARRFWAGDDERRSEAALKKGEKPAERDTSFKGKLKVAGKNLQENMGKLSASETPGTRKRRAGGSMWET